MCLNLDSEGALLEPNSILKGPNLHKVIPAKLDFQKLAPYFGYRPRQVIHKTIENTTQLAKAIIHMPLRRHFKSRFHMLRRKRRNEMVATDTYFSTVPAICGATCAQVFYGCKTRILRVYGLATESQFPSALSDFLREEGIPHTLKRDNAKSEKSEEVEEINRKYLIADSFTEPHHPHQNPAELCGVKYLKNHAQVLMDRVGAPDNLWLLAQEYLCEVHNVCADPSNNWRIPIQVSEGDTPDISHLLVSFLLV